MTERRTRHDEGVFASAMRDEGMCVIVDATICERQDQADKRKACLVTAQVLRLLDEPLGEV